MPSKSSSQTRGNNAIPQPSIYSVYFSGEVAVPKFYEPTSPLSSASPIASFEPPNPSMCLGKHRIACSISGGHLIQCGGPNGLTERLTQGASGTPSIGRNA